MPTFFGVFLSGTGAVCALADAGGIRSIADAGAVCVLADKRALILVKAFFISLRL